MAFNLPTPKLYFSQQGISHWTHQSALWSILVRIAFKKRPVINEFVIYKVVAERRKNTFVEAYLASMTSNRHIDMRTKKFHLGLYAVYLPNGSFWLTGSSKLS